LFLLLLLLKGAIISCLKIPVPDPGFKGAKKSWGLHSQILLQQSMEPLSMAAGDVRFLSPLLRRLRGIEGRTPYILEYYYVHYLQHQHLHKIC